MRTAFPLSRTGCSVQAKYAVEDNGQLKDDRKDPKLIANPVKDGNFGMPYLPEKVYADLRRLSMFRDQLNEDRIRNINCLNREMKIYFSGVQGCFGKTDGLFCCLEILRIAPFPEDLLKLGEDGIRQIWHEAKLRGRGYSRAGEIIKCASESVGLRDGTEASKTAARWFAEKIMELDKQLADIEEQLRQKCSQIPHAEKILEISGIGENTISGILAEMGTSPDSMMYRKSRN